MADYVTITDAQVDPEAPITSELMSALRDNPIAIAEGAPGAPRVNICERTLIYDNGGNVSTIESDDFEDGFYYRFIFENVETDGGNGDNYIALDFMKESDSSYVGTFGSTYLKVGYFSSGTPVRKTNGVVTVFAPRVLSNHFFAHGFFATGIETNIFSGDTDGQFAGGRVYVGATATKIKRIRFWGTDRLTTNRNFLSGKIYQEKLNSDV